jgi:septum formation protein
MAPKRSKLETALPMSRLPSLILASQSPRRRELLGQLGIEFDVSPARVEELHHEEFTATELSLLNAHRKARAVAKQYPDCLVLGADTLVVLENRRYGKPANLGDASRMLAELAGHTHQVVTGVCLLHLRTRRESLFAETTNVTFRPLTPAQIAAYLDAVNPLDKAGAYGIQERGTDLVANLTGSFSNVVGLPLERLQAELELWGAQLRSCIVRTGTSWRGRSTKAGCRFESKR